jgi:drug/metabolite transporter (DMT)-like permease
VTTPSAAAGPEPAASAPSTAAPAGTAPSTAAPAGTAPAGTAPASRRTLRIAEVAALLVMFSWGMNVVAVKAALAEVPPLIFAFVRFGTAFLVLLAVLKLREGSVGLPRRDIVPVFLLGLAGFGLYQDLWATALGQTTASNSALITAATPVSTMLLCAAVGSDTLSRAKIVGGAVAFAGAVGVVVATHGIGITGASLGDLMTFAATVCWAVYVAFGTPVLVRHSPLRTATWTIGLGSLGILPFAIGQAASFDPGRIHAGTVGIVLFCALIPAAAANVVLFEAVKVLGPARTMLFQFLVPAFAVVLAAAFLGEAIVVGQLIGGGVIVLGILVARSPARSRWRRARFR